MYINFKDLNYPNYLSLASLDSFQFPQFHAVSVGPESSAYRTHTALHSALCRLRSDFSKDNNLISIVQLSKTLVKHWCYFFYLYQEQKVQLIDIISTVPTSLAFQNRQLQARLTSTIQCMALDLKILTITIDRLTFFWSFLRRLVLQVFVTSFLCMRVLISFHRRHSSQTF